MKPGQRDILRRMKSGTPYEVAYGDAMRALCRAEGKTGTAWKVQDSPDDPDRIEARLVEALTKAPATRDQLAERLGIEVQKVSYWMRRLRIQGRAKTDRQYSHVLWRLTGEAK